MVLGMGLLGTGVRRTAMACEGQLKVGCRLWVLILRS